MIAPKNMPQPRLDEELLKRTLDDFTALMQAALMTDARGRFQIVGQLANQANMLQQLGGARVADFDGEDDFGINLVGAQQMGGGILGGGRRLAIAGGDQMEMIRTMIDAVTAAMDKQNLPKRMAPADELNSLLTSRQMLWTMNENTEDLDRRISALRKELTDVVVPADVLRGHPPEAPGGPGDPGELGEDHGDGADRAAGAVREGEGQEVDRSGGRAG